MSKEREARVWPGWPVLALTIALYVFGAVMLAPGGTWEVWTGLGRARARGALFARLFYVAAQRGESSHPVRTLQGHDAPGRVPLGKPIVQQRLHW